LYLRLEISDLRYQFFRTNGGTTTSVCVVPLRYASAVCGCAGCALRGGWTSAVVKATLYNV
ncbi:MAG: hypothetical protein ACTS6P_01885, partial [Candidatus Hodgkinia cicadicola]